MARKASKRRSKKEDIVLYEQTLEPSDILSYIPKSFKERLSSKERQYIKDAFYLAVMKYKQGHQQNYIDRMLI